VFVVDDQLLLDVLSEQTTPSLGTALAGGEIFTTASWYYRPGRAVSAGSGTGSPSARFEALEPSTRDLVHSDLDVLPEEVGLVNLRIVVPLMRPLWTRHRLNFLNAEAVGAALLLDATVLMTTLAEIAGNAGQLGPHFSSMPPSS
jgi:hypothetical protein